MLKQQIDICEKYLAFRCLNCKNQVAENVDLKASILKCPICGGRLIQMTYEDISMSKWKNYIVNPYYMPRVTSLGFFIILSFILVVILLLWLILK